MLTTYEVEAALQGVSGDPDDVYVNRWHFFSATPGTAASDAEVIEAMLLDFYNATPAGRARSISQFLGPTVRRNGGLRILTYDLLDPKPRVPVSDVTFNLQDGPAGQGLVNAAAILLQERTEPSSGINRARTRGWTAIGPVAAVASVATQDAMGELIPAEQARLDVRAAAADLMVISASQGIPWVVFSRATAGAEPWTLEDLSDASNTVDEVRIGRAFAIIRRRMGRQPRDTWFNA